MTMKEWPPPNRNDAPVGQTDSAFCPGPVTTREQLGITIEPRAKSPAPAYPMPNPHLGNGPGFKFGDLIPDELSSDLANFDQRMADVTTEAINSLGEAFDKTATALKDGDLKSWKDAGKGIKKAISNVGAINDELGDIVNDLVDKKIAIPAKKLFDGLAKTTGFQSQFALDTYVQAFEGEVLIVVDVKLVKTLWNREYQLFDNQYVTICAETRGETYIKLASVVDLKDLKGEIDLGAGVEGFAGLTFRVNEDAEITGYDWADSLIKNISLEAGYYKDINFIDPDHSIEGGGIRLLFN